MNDNMVDQHAGEPILVVRDHHIPREPPPHLDGDKTWPVFYFQGSCGDQWLVWWDGSARQAYLTGGDVGWIRFVLPEDREARARHRAQIEAIMTEQEHRDEGDDEWSGGDRTLPSLMLELEEKLCLAGALMSLSNQVGGQELAEDAYMVVENVVRAWTKVCRKAWPERMQRGDFERTRAIWEEHHGDD